jgi:hypothetical protein
MASKLAVAIFILSHHLCHIIYSHARVLMKNWPHSYVSSFCVYPSILCWFVVATNRRNSEDFFETKKGGVPMKSLSEARLEQRNTEPTTIHSHSSVDISCSFLRSHSQPSCEYFEPPCLLWSLWGSFSETHWHQPSWPHYSPQTLQRSTPHTHWCYCFGPIETTQQNQKWEQEDSPDVGIATDGTTILLTITL